MTPSVPLVTLDGADADQKSLLSRVPPINLFRALAHAPQLATRVAALGHAVTTQTALTSREVELIALRCAGQLQGHYVVNLHRRIAQSLGINAEQAAAAEGHGAPDSLDSGARNLLTMVDAALDPRALPRALGVPARTEVEAALVTGYFVMLAIVTRQLGVPPDDFDVATDA